MGRYTIVDDYATVAAHGILGARIHIDKGAHVGLNSTVREDIRVGCYAIVGMGAVVVKNVDDYAVVAGNPAKFIKSLYE